MTGIFLRFPTLQSGNALFWSMKRQSIVRIDDLAYEIGKYPGIERGVNMV